MKRYWAIVDGDLGTYHVEFDDFDEAKGSLLRPTDHGFNTALGVCDTHTNDVVYFAPTDEHGEAETKKIELEAYIEEHNPLPRKPSE